MKTTYNKLVRDRIPEVIQASGKTAEFETLDDNSFRSALLAKLVEEAQEVQSAKPEELAIELADVLEVVSALIQAYGLSPNEVTRQQQQRHAERGGFARRIFLRSIEQDKRSPA